MDSKDSVKIRQAKEFDSFSKRVRVNNRIWFDALSKTRKYDLFYEWKFEKYSVEKKKIVRMKMCGSNIVYPAKLKHFIKEKKKQFRYQPMTSNLRDSMIDYILENKN
jgi:hypothetical protein